MSVRGFGFVVVLVSVFVFVPVHRLGVAAAQEIDVRNEKTRTVEECLALPPAEVITRCPSVGGRVVAVGGARYAVVERYEPKRATLFCDESAGRWRCKKVVVLDRDLRDASKRNPQSFITLGELFRFIAAAPSLRVGDELGALFDNPNRFDRARTCLQAARRGCVTQAARLRVMGPGNTPLVKRRLWLVEDADGPAFLCSDAALSRCDALDGASLLALILTLRPSSQAPALPEPELDVPEVRGDKRPLPKASARDEAPALAEAQDTAAGALEPAAKGRALPRRPSRADALKLSRALGTRGRACLLNPTANVTLTLTGQGNLLALTVDGAAAGSDHDCLVNQTRALPLPRFAASTWHTSTLVRKK